MYVLGAACRVRLQLPGIPIRGHGVLRGHRHTETAVKAVRAGRAPSSRSAVMSTDKQANDKVGTDFYLG